MMTTFTHARLSALLFCLLLVDGSFVYYMLSRVLVQVPSVLILFVFEYAILCVTVITTLGQYGLYGMNNRMEGRWQSMSVWKFYLDTCSALVQLLLYLVFFVVICSCIGTDILTDVLHRNTTTQIYYTQTF